MSEFNEFNWKMALNAVFQRSIKDPDFRSLCVSDPYAAVAQVSDIELPPGLNLQFFDKRADFVYAFLLPPVPEGQQGLDAAQEMIRWSALCTDFTTTITEPPT